MPRKSDAFVRAAAAGTRSGGRPPAGRREHRVRFWEAFHVLRGIARLEGAYDGTRSPFAPPDRGVLPTELARELPRRYQQLTRVR